MHIFWVILAECLLALIDFLTMKFIENRGFRVIGIKYGFKPVLYDKTINNFQFTLGIIPFFGGLASYESNVKKYTPKFLSPTVYAFLCELGFPFLLILTLMIIMVLSFCGLETTRIVLQLIFTMNINLIDWVLLFNKLDNLAPIVRMPISISIYITIFYLYAGILRQLVYIVLEKVLKITSDATQYVVTTILLYILINNIPDAFYGHLLNFSTFSPFMLLDWLIGHCIFITIVGLIIEVIARKQQETHL